MNSPMNLAQKMNLMSNLLDDERKKILTREAEALQRDGLNQTQLLRELKRVNQATCVPTLKDGDVRDIILNLQSESFSSPISLYNSWHAEPVTLSTTTTDAPLLSSDLIPLQFRGWVMDAAERMHVAPEAIMAPALVGLSSVVGRKIGIFPKNQDDWLVVPNLWGATIAPPGSNKSQAIIEGLRPLERLEENARASFSKRQHKLKTQQLIADIKFESLKRSLSSAIRKEDHQATQYFARKIEEVHNEKETVRRYKSNDVSLEAIALLVANNPNGLLIVKDDLHGFLRMLAKSKHDVERKFFSASWRGVGSYTIDDPKAGSLHVPSLALSMFGGLHPDKLHEYLQKVQHNSPGGCSFIQRFQILIYPQQFKDWENVDKGPNLLARESVFDVFHKIDSVPNANNGYVPAVRFTKAAQEAFDDWRQNLERRLYSDDISSSALRAHLINYRSLMPSLALLFWVLEGPENIHAWGSVSLSATNLAIRWCEFLEKHAAKIYNATKNAQTMAAQRLARYIERGEISEGASIDSIYQSQLPDLGTKSLVNKALKALEERNWLRVSKESSGRNVKRVWLHPKFSRQNGSIFELPS